MIALHQGQSGEKVIVTLTEFQTLPDPYFLFLFEHVTTKVVVSVIKHSDEDESGAPDRYNQFDFDTASVFNGQAPGEWHYKVYEQNSAINTDPALSGAMLENGKLKLLPSTEFEFDKYDQPVTFKSYNG